MEKEKTVLEVCTDSIESAIAAKKGGADRIELCSNLIIGGTTPDTKMYRIIQNEAEIPARILIRPRFGDFCYSKYEKELILEALKKHNFNRTLTAEALAISRKTLFNKMKRYGLSTDEI